VTKKRAARIQNEPGQGAQRDHDDQGQDGAGDPDHDDIEIPVTMRGPTKCKHRHHRTVLRQRVERARADCGNAVDRCNRAVVLHQLAERGAGQKKWEELRQELRGAAHEGLRPVGQQWLTAEQRGQ